MSVREKGRRREKGGREGENDLSARKID